MSRPLTYEELQGFWRFHHDHGVLAADSFCFLPTGEIGGYDHYNERYWRLDDGVLCLLDQNRRETTRFELVSELGGRLSLSGRHLVNSSIVLYLTQLSTRWEMYSLTRYALRHQIDKYGWSIGDHTYGVPAFIEEALSPLVIGKYTSIATGVTISFGDHRLDLVTTYPFRSLAEYWPTAPGVEDHVSKGGVTIGSDVWLGMDAFIASGVTIGHGAVIGARSVVTKDVPPYAIVVGANRVVRFRFAPGLVAALLEVAWWDWPDAVVAEALPFLMQGDIGAFIAHARGYQPGAKPKPGPKAP